ncbi:lysozyme [Serratia aquatilis]|uniref:Lysozyme n=1 Tax=Serratia aquatilis TaxID=1737515 RepID=A0ABV6EER1_9GAMM
MSAETIDSLLVSLGLETDAKSFQKANDAIKGVKDTVLQLGAASGTALSFNALTAGVAKTTLEMSRLSKNTGFTIRQIDGLRSVMNSLDIEADSAFGIVQKIFNLQEQAKFGELGDRAYWSGIFDPQKFAGMKDKMEALKYLVASYEKMDASQKRIFRSGMPEGDDSPLVRTMEMGIGKLNERLEKFYSLPGSGVIDQGLLDSSQKFNDELGTLKSNFELLGRSMAKDLLPPVNALLKAVNGFAKEHPDAAKYGLYAAGAGGSYAGWKLLQRFLPGTGNGAGTSGSSWISRFLMNPVTISAASVFTPGNIFTSAEDARSMSNPEALRRRNWALNNPGVPYPRNDMSPQSLYSGNAPRGIRNNNPGNLNFAGQSGASLENGPNARFAKFETMEQGIAALHRQIGLYLARGENTLSDIVNTYAPASDSNDVQAYISSLSNATGLGAFDRINPDDSETLIRLVKGIIDYENGTGYVSLADVAGGVNSGPDLSNYQYLSSTPPNPILRNNTNSGTVIQQTNHNTINANGVDAEEVIRRMDERNTLSLNYALSLTKTDNY